LRALQVDVIDLSQLHWPDPNTPLEATAATLAELVDAGKIRHAGVSNFNAGTSRSLGRDP
jgi:aryl-alcohol dehydrogenase-like predicted oxidoreductase